MTRRVHTLALNGLAMLLGVLGACNEHDPHPPNVTDPGNGGATSGGAAGGGGSSSSSGGALDGGALDGETTDAGAVCTDLDPPSVLVDENAVPSDIPVGNGGTLVDGIYDLQTAEKYVGLSTPGGPTGVTFREVIRITGGTSLERLLSTQLNNGPTTDTNASYVLQQNGTSIVLTQKCPIQSAAETFSFTSADGRLTLISQAGESFTYVGRP
jgi:hypothetical protein